MKEYAGHERDLATKKELGSKENHMVVKGVSKWVLN
jgi:hypothetical protein